MKYRIPVITRTQDNGDGGFTTYAYNTEDELIADHPKSEGEGKVVNGKWVSEKIVISQEERNDILNEYDPYENGMISHGEIIVEIGEDGAAKLSKPLHFHAGQ